MDFHLGANQDTRPQAARDKDYHADEIAGAPTVVPFENPKTTELKATIFSQEYVGDCVPHGFLTTLEYEGILPPTLASQLVTYRQRANYPEAGSIAVDIWDKIRAGIKANAFFPTPIGFTEAQATAMPLVSGDKLPKDFNYFGISNYGTIPGEVAAGKAVAIFIYASEAEWSEEYVEPTDKSVTIQNAYVRHCVCLPPKGDFTENGKEWLTVHDSARFGNRNLRYISPAFLLSRAFYSGKAYAAGTLPTPPNPTVPLKPTTPCKYGDKGSDAVRALQAFLARDGKLGAEYVTGNYLALTAKAVLWWQLEHWDRFAENVPELLSYGGQYWGKESIAIIN